MKLKISKLLLESASIFQARNDVRYCLNGICFMPDGRIASTDGHRAFIGGSHDNKLTENVIIKIGKSPAKRYEYAIIDTKSKIATYHDEAGAMVGSGICEEIDGRFPDIDRVIAPGRAGYHPPLAHVPFGIRPYPPDGRGCRDPFRKGL